MLRIGLRAARWLVRVSAACVLGVAPLAGCATVPVSDHAPATGRGVAGVKLEADGASSCLVPCRMDLTAMPGEFDLRVRVDGYLDGRVVMRRSGPDLWNADIGMLGTAPCLAVDPVEGVVYGVDFHELRRARPHEAAALGAPLRGQLHGVLVTGGEPSWVPLLRLIRA